MLLFTGYLQTNMKLLKSIRFKLILIALLPVIIITSLIVYSDVKNTKEKLIESQKEKAVLLSDTIRKSITLLMIENRWAELQSLVEDMIKGNPELKEVRIFHPSSGRIIVSADTKEIGERIYKEDWERFKRQEEYPYIIRKDGNLFATKITTIKNEPACFKCHSPSFRVLGVIDVEVSLATAEQYIQELTFKHFSGLIIGFFVISAIFLLGGELIINSPLNRLTKAMKRVESGDFSVRIEDGRDDEIGYLTSVFNNMINTIELSKKELQKCHLQQMEKASKLASIGEIVSGIAHEIKNPLAGISCAIQVLHSEIGNDETKKTIINEVFNQIKRLDRTVKDLLDYAKPKPPTLVLTNINDIIRRILFLIYSEARNNKVVIETDIEEGIPEFMIDPDQMQQVFLNLAINAIQAMPGGGRLGIKIFQKDYSEIQEQIQLPSKNDKILIMKFEDTGTGISQEDMENVFEPFFTKKTKGTGLGLPITQKIINEHGGKITVQSELGKGSVFTIYLPIKTSHLSMQNK